MQYGTGNICIMFDHVNSYIVHLHPLQMISQIDTSMASPGISPPAMSDYSPEGQVA